MSSKSHFKISLYKSFGNRTRSPSGRTRGMSVASDMLKDDAGPQRIGEVFHSGTEQGKESMKSENTRAGQFQELDGKDVTTLSSEPDIESGHIGTSGAQSTMYSPIASPDTIRLIILQPGKDPEPLRCTFHMHETLDDHTAAMYVKYRGSAADYTAISYTWHADPGSKEYGSILCDDKYLQITRNLSNLLHRLRGEASSWYPQMLWIDQICINQNDEEEKEQQIPLMRKIYQQAQKVVFWIGEEDQNTTTAFDLIEKLYVVWDKIDAENPQFAPNGAISDDNYTSNLGLPSLSSGQWRPLLELFAHQVLRRLWIVQEIVLGHSVSVVCGSHTIDFQKFGGAASYLAGSDWISILQTTYVHLYLEGIDLSNPNQLIEAEEMGRVDFLVGLYNRRTNLRWHRHETFEQLLLSTRRYKTDREFRQDKVFALLGLLSAHTADGQIPNELLPSYAKSYEIVFRETTQYLLCQGSLDILSGVEDLSLRPDNLNVPSWVPNYDVFQKSTILGMPSHAPVVNFAAGGDASPQDKPTWRGDEPGILYIDAYKVDEAQMFRGSLQTNDLVLSGYQYLEDSAKLVDLFSIYPTGEDVIDAFWRTLIANTGSSMTYPAPEHWRRHFMGYCMQAAVSIKFMIEMKKLEQEGLWPSSTGADLGTLLSERFKPEGHHRNILLIVQTESGTFPLWPMVMNQWVPGLYNVFALGLLSRVEPSYYANTNGSMYGSAMKQFSFFRRFFVTRDEYFGLAPPSAEPGDGIFVLKGGRVPFLLRKAEDGLYGIVGECYVHGIMHGEALKREGFKWERIGIR